MFDWDNIIKYYEAMSKFPREGHVWDEVRYHCQETLRLIPEIRRHPILQTLEPFLDAKHLHLLNRQNKKIAVLFSLKDGTTKITLYHTGEGLDFDKHVQLRPKTSDVIKVLVTWFADN